MIYKIPTSLCSVINVPIFIPVSKMICQQINAIVKVEANHLANKYAREYKNGREGS